MVELCCFKLLIGYEVQRAENGFKQVEIAYLATISHLDELSSQVTVAKLHTMYTIQATGTVQGLLARLSPLTFRSDNADYGQFLCC